MAIEDREIEALIRKQEAAGLKSITDGEYRRASWQTDFLVALDGVEFYVGERKFKFQGHQPRPILLRINKKLGGYVPHPMIEHYRFVQSKTKQTPKMTIPSPSTLHFRYGREAVPEAIYPSMDDFYRDLGITYRKAVRAFADAGCRYLQLDEVNLTYLCDPELRKQVATRGDDPDKLPVVYAEMINAAMSDIPADMTISMHLCRGNFRSTHVASGGYEPVAEILFNTINVHGYFMEYDTERAGGFEPLRFVPKGKTVVLGLVTSKAGQLESRDLLRRRIDEAAKFVPIDQLALSPQCGFASTEEGNALAEDEQWAKLRMIVELSEEVWGR
jgi:5-methyltetrahydropteroyltriglutamate--homocysteine methyltransferase